MDLLRIGRSLRALRIRRGWRQVDVAAAAGVSRSQVARVERGESRGVPAQDFDAIARALGAELDIRLRWHGEGLDRMLDEAHAWLVDRVVVLLQRWGWEVAVEVSFSIGGERGSIDILAFNPQTGDVLVIEVKSVVPDAQAMLATLDRKARLGSRIAADRGWAARRTSRLLVIGDDPTARRRVTELGATFATAFPIRGPRVRAWLREPTGSASGLLFLAYGQGTATRRAGVWRQRVGRRSTARARSLTPARPTNPAV